MPISSIKAIIYLVALLGVTPAAWAGAAEEVAVIGEQRAAAFEKGDIDTYIAAFADNAVFTPSLQAFRVEGKAALKNYVSALHAGVSERYYRCAERVLRPHNDR